MIVLAIAVLISLVPLVCCASRLFGKGNPFYASLVLYGVSCFTLSLVFAFIHRICAAWLFPVDIGQIGIFGCGAFLLSANFGQIDGIVDEGNRENRGYRLLALLAPAVLCTIAVLIFPRLEDSWRSQYPVYLLFMLPSFVASYFNLKHLLLPVDDFGFLRMTRPTNICALIFYPSLLLAYLAKAPGSILPEDFFTVWNAALSGCIALSALKGAKLWKTSI